MASPQAARHRGRWQSADYDALYRSTESKLDPARRAAMYLRMNELVAEAVMAGNLLFPHSPWRVDTSSPAHWFRET